MTAIELMLVTSREISEPVEIQLFATKMLLWS